MNKYLKILLYFFTSVLVFNFIIFSLIFLAGYDKNKSFKYNLQNIGSMFYYAYFFLFMAIFEGILGYKKKSNNSYIYPSSYLNAN